VLTKWKEGATGQHDPPRPSTDSQATGSRWLPSPLLTPRGRKHLRRPLHPPQAHHVAGCRRLQASRPSRAAGDQGRRRPRLAAGRSLPPPEATQTLPETFAGRHCRRSPPPFTPHTGQRSPQSCGPPHPVGGRLDPWSPTAADEVLGYLSGRAHRGEPVEGEENPWWRGRGRRREEWQWLEFAAWRRSRESDARREGARGYFNSSPMNDLVIYVSIYYPYRM
jgi:hypothetical protein